MKRELVRREPWPERIEHANKAALLREVRRAYAAGELGAVGPVWQGPTGYWVEVLRLKERRVVPAWRKPLLVASGAGAVLVGLGAAGWWLAGMTATALSAVSVPLVATVAALLWLASRALSSSSGGGGCETTVTVTHRHRS